MSYLAAAQYFGLEGLWQKLCAGKLPERCSKQWYFATFCSMDADAFEEGAYDELGASADIGAHLNGFVKPYDVIALMTVLPVSKQLFPQSALFEHRGVQHLLLLEEKHAVRALPVVNLLRETYHEVVLVTTARRNAGMATPAGKINVRRFNLQAMLGSTAGGGLASRRQLLQQGKQKQQGKAPAKALRAERYALNKPACTSSTQISDGASPRKSASHALGPVSDDGDVGHAQEREYSAVISHDDIVELLSNVLALAGQRQRAITTATLAIGCTLVVACFTAFAASVLVTEWLTPVQVEIAHTSTGACALTGGAFVHLSLSPTPAHRARIRLVAIAFGAFVGTAWALDDEKARLLRTVMPGYAPEYAAIDPANTRFFVAYSVVHALVHNLTWGGSSFALIALAIASRFTRQVSTRLLLCALWAHLGGASLFLAISRSVSNTLNYSAGTWVYANAQDQAHALFVFNAVIGPLLLAQAVATQFAGFRHSLIRLISQTSSALGTEASVAPLLGFGSRRGERAPEDVCDEAERAFRPRALEPALLAEIEAAGLGAKCEQLVLLAGPALLEHLEPVAHCFAWEAIGGRVRDAHVELVAADTSTRADIIAGIDTFHVMNTRAAAEEVHERLLAMVEIASASRVNVALRELLEAAQRAARAQSDGNTGAAPRKKRASRMRRVSANTSARARPRAAAHVLAWLRERGAGEQPSAERCA
ncbi:hypothetical protein KFE25_010295 [Diacronema lutheri]|uniref:Uncharacterized protein n=1 Tax=Diacronema lutheri TaxID=2081491 RepID=A0A8J6CAC6_DIALT|nr:hypothetical protein KFE25_010295 [Diacronema lutheri]